MNHLHTVNLQLVAALATLLGLSPTYAIRFIPKEQKRLDTRGRTIATYEAIRDAVQDLHAMQEGTLRSKEPEHGHYYLAVEARSALVEKSGAGRRSKDHITVPLPFPVRQPLPDDAAGQPTAADSLQAAHDVPAADRQDGKAGQRAAGEKAGGPHEPVGQVTARPQDDDPEGTFEPRPKVDLSKIGMR